MKGNLSPAPTDEDLRKAFVGSGHVESVHLTEDTLTGQSRGFGFVALPETVQAQETIARLNGSALGGKILAVNEARPRRQRGGEGKRRSWYAVRG